ncbi:MAG: alpha/beta fold hydrolase [Alphaproteobacteria bacterium]
MTAAEKIGPRFSGAYRERVLSAQDGLRLYTRDYDGAQDAGAALLCLTGLTRNSKDYHDFALGFAGKRRVLSPDYRGRGRSARDQDWRNYNPSIYISDIRHLLAASNCHRVIVVGTSLGAILAMGLAVVVPGVLAGAILNDAGPELDPAGIARILGYVGDESTFADWHAASRRVQELFPSLSIDGEAGWREFAGRTFIEGEDGALHYDWDPAIARQLGGQKSLPDLWPLFRALRPFPVLALRGETSDVLSVETFERMGEDMPNLTRVTVPGVGHVPTLAEPIAKRAIDEFLKDL